MLDDKKNHVPIVKITTPNGQTAETDSHGNFFLAFPPSVKPGQATRIEVVRPNWVIYEPMLGNCTTQSAERNYEPLKVIIVPKGSPLALSPERLGKVIARWADERVKLRGQVNQLSSQLDQYAFLKEYSEKYGFTLEQFDNAAQQWAQSKESGDGIEQALKEYFLKNYDRAAQLGLKSAFGLDPVIEQERTKQLEDSRKQIVGFKTAGNAFYEQSKFRDALAAYNEIERRFSTRKLSKEDLINEWAEIKLLVGNTKEELGTSVEGQESQLLLSEAVEDYQQALTVYTREQLPQQWATTQNNLGIVLSSQGEQLEGAEGVKLLAQAVEAYRAALIVYTREQLPQQWAATQNNLGVVLRSQGERLEGAEGVKLLQQSVEAFRAALTIRTREQLPQQWATTQNNLGIVLSSQGERLEGAEGVKLLAQAVEAYRAALIVYTREQLPQQWATTQNNLGNVLSSQGERLAGIEGVKLLQQSVEAFRAALTIRIREQLPRQWVQTQNNLAKTYFLLQNWPGAAESYAYVLALYPDYEEAYTRLSAIYHEILFKFDDAFTLNQEWLARHSDDVSAQADFAEKYFTTGRFAECGQRIAALFNNKEVSASTKAALRVIEIADLLAMAQTTQVHARMETLIAEVSSQPAEFKVDWSFEGTKHFIAQHEKLSPYRAWLGQLFAAITRPTRDQIVKGLNETKIAFK